MTSLIFTSIQQGQTDVWRATQKEPQKYWWQNNEFNLEKRLVHDRIPSGVDTQTESENLVATPSV
jgi:hypothetical protein